MPFTQIRIIKDFGFSLSEIVLSSVNITSNSKGLLIMNESVLIIVIAIGIIIAAVISSLSLAWAVKFTHKHTKLITQLNSEHFAKERNYNFQKEYLFKLQDKSSEIIKSIHSLKEIVSKFKTDIENRSILLGTTIPGKQEGIKKLIFNQVVVFFPELASEYNNLITAFSNLSESYFGLAKVTNSKGFFTLNQFDLDKFVSMFNEFSKAEAALLQKLQLSIKTEKEKLLS